MLPFSPEDALKDIRLTLGRNVRRRRQRLGLTMEALSELAGIHWTFLGHIERGQKAPSLGVLACLAHALDTTPSRLLQP